MNTGGVVYMLPCCGLDVQYVETHATRREVGGTFLLKCCLDGRAPQLTQNLYY